MSLELQHDKLNCYGASQNDRFLCLKIGLLHQENINYLCFGAKRKDLPLNQDSKIILHSTLFEGSWSSNLS